MEQILRGIVRAAVNNHDAACMSPFSTPEERARLQGRQEAYIVVLAIMTGRSIEELNFEYNVA